MSKFVSMLTKTLCIILAVFTLLGDKIAKSRAEARQQLHISVEKAIFEAKRVGVNKRTLNRIARDYYDESGMLYGLYCFCRLKKAIYDRRVMLLNAKKQADEECTRLATRRVQLDAKLVHVQMTFADRAAWEEGVAMICRNPDLTRSLAIVDFAERWARLMELRMDKGESLYDIAYEAALEADVDHAMVFAFDFPQAWRLLTESWMYGYELRYAINEQVSDTLSMA